MRGDVAKQGRAANWNYFLAIYVFTLFLIIKIRICCAHAHPLNAKSRTSVSEFIETLDGPKRVCYLPGAKILRRPLTSVEAPFPIAQIRNAL